MRLVMFMAILLWVEFLSPVIDAKIWYINDYQRKELYKNRANSPQSSQDGVDLSKPNPDDAFNCNIYGYKEMTNIGADYTCESVYTVSNKTCCSAWICNRVNYPNTSCRSDQIPTGECVDKNGTRHYRECKCNTTTYPYTTSNCTYDLSGSSCVDSSGTRYSKCTQDPCNKAQSENVCVKNCDYGCARTYSGCSDCCTECKTCVPTDCEGLGYSLACPSNAVCNDTCNPGCEDDRKFYKPTGCTNDYEIITSDMDADAIEAKLAATGKITLVGDITLNRGLNINNASVEINGNGHTIKYTATSSGESVIKVNGSNASANIKNIAINAYGEQLYGISAINGGKITLDNTNKIQISGTGTQKIWFRDEGLYNGKSDTEIMINEVGANALAATACNQFYLTDKNGEFGQNHWYLPAIGEFMNAHGYDTTQITKAFDNIGAIGNNQIAIQNSLSILNTNGNKATTLIETFYWVSTEYGQINSFLFNPVSGHISSRNKTEESYNAYGRVRCFLLLKNCFDPINENNIPKIGDVLYYNKTWEDATNYKKNNSMTAVGIITEVLDDGSVKIINLKDLTFKNETHAGNFNPENPYKETYHTTHYTTKSSQIDFKGLNNYNGNQLLEAFKSSGDIKINFAKEAVSICGNTN